MERHEMPPCLQQVGGPGCLFGAVVAQRGGNELARAQRLGCGLIIRIGPRYDHDLLE